MKESWPWARSRLFKCWETCFQGAVQLNTLNIFIYYTLYNIVSVLYQISYTIYYIVCVLVHLYEQVILNGWRHVLYLLFLSCAAAMNKCHMWSPDTDQVHSFALGVKGEQLCLHLLFAHLSLFFWFACFALKQWQWIKGRDMMVLWKEAATPGPGFWVQKVEGGSQVRWFVCQF